MQTSLPFTVFGGLALACGILVCCLPETSGKPLPDNITVEVTVDLPLSEQGEQGTHQEHLLTQTGDKH